MPIIYIDGPERAGKSTVADAIRDQYGARVRHWGPVNPDDRVYGPAMQADIATRDLVVWDRGWAAEHVYGNLLGRARRLAGDPWLGEWVHGRAVRTVGVQCILLGPSAHALDSKRDESDKPELPVDAGVERDSFRLYGEWFNYLVVENEHTMEEVDRWANVLATTAREVDAAAKGRGVIPPWYAGPPDAPVVFVGEKHAKHATIPGSWLPLTSKYGATLGRDLGDFALECGWVNAADCPPQALRDVELVVSLGAVAGKWVDNYVRPGWHVNIFHPAYIYRLGKQDERLAAYREKLTAIREKFEGVK